MRAPLLTVALLALCGGCAHSLNDVYVGDFTPGTRLQNAKIVEARAEQFAVLGFVYDTNYVDQARDDLMKQCESGRLEGVTTESETDLGFLSWTNKVMMKGYCIPDKAT